MSKAVNYPEEFEQEEKKINIRFLEEVENLKARKEIKTQREYASLINTHNSFIAEVKSGRYKVNIRTLWLTKKLFPSFDIEYVLFGIRTTSLKPEPALQ